MVGVIGVGPLHAVKQSKAVVTPVSFEEEKTSLIGFFVVIAEAST